MAKDHSNFGTSARNASKSSTAGHRRVDKGGSIADNGNPADGTGTRNASPNDSGAPGAHGNDMKSGTP